MTLGEVERSEIEAGGGRRQEADLESPLQRIDQEPAPVLAERREAVTEPGPEQAQPRAVGAIDEDDQNLLRLRQPAAAVGAAAGIVVPRRSIARRRRSRPGAKARMGGIGAFSQIKE